MRKNIFTALTIVTSFAAVGTALAHNHGGHPLTDAKGLSLQTDDKDAANTSNCDDDCAEKWPFRDPLQLSKSL